MKQIISEDYINEQESKQRKLYFNLNISKNVTANFFNNTWTNKTSKFLEALKFSFSENF